MRERDLNPEQHAEKTNTKYDEVTLIILNVVVEWLTLLHRIREVPVSNLGPRDRIPENFCECLQSLQANSGTVP
jgi:hypothetical protein